MCNLATNSKEKLDLTTLGSKLKLIALEHPGVDDYAELATLVSDTFAVNCTAEHIYQYMDLHNQAENFERESKLIEYGDSY